jgi:hypothetical protein
MAGSYDDGIARFPTGIERLLLLLDPFLAICLAGQPHHVAYEVVEGVRPDVILPRFGGHPC